MTRTLHYTSCIVYAIVIFLLGSVYLYKIVTYEENYTLVSEIKLPLVKVNNEFPHGHLHKITTLESNAISMINNPDIMVWISRNQFSIFIQYEGVEILPTYQYILQESIRIRGLMLDDLNTFLTGKDINVEQSNDYELPDILSIHLVRGQGRYMYIFKLTLLLFISLALLIRFYFSKKRVIKAAEYE